MSLKISGNKKIPKSLYKEYDVITVGSGTVDIFVSTQSQVKKFHKENILNDLIAYKLGSKILINDLKFYVGGGGTNTAVSFSRLGLKTGWIGKTGNCENSSNILEILRDERIDFLGNFGKTISGYSIILDSIKHDRTILTYKGDNDNLTFNEINKKKLKTKWFYFSSMVGKSFVTQKKLAKFAFDNNIKLAFNPSSYQAKLGKNKLKQILRYTDLLVLNVEEAELLVGKSDIKTTVVLLHKLGPEMVIITEGKKGAFCSDKKVLYKIYAPPVNVVETTGAGDAFASTFLAAFIKTSNMKKSLQLALVNAQSVIQAAGAKSNLLTWSKANKVLNSKNIKITTKNI